MSLVYNIPQEMPVWFTPVKVAFSEMQSMYSNTTMQISELSKIIDDLEERFMAHLKSSEKNTALSHRNQSSHDECEIRVSNIPESCKLQPYVIATSILNAIDCHLLCAQIIHARIWKATASASRVNSSRGTYSIVFQLSSCQSRDRAMRNAARLRNFSVRDLLGVDDKSRLYMNQLLPKPVYELYRKACNRARELNFMRPLVRNLEIFMRKSFDSDLTLVQNESDLNSLYDNDNSPVLLPTPLQDQDHNQPSISVREHESLKVVSGSNSSAPNTTSCPQSNGESPLGSNLQSTSQSGLKLPNSNHTPVWKSRTKSKTKRKTKSKS